jgi:two-component system alkaline phosphatase synthesis response regulator PhoP
MAKAAKKKPVVLLADDDPEILAILRTQLTRKGYEVHEAFNGVETITKAREIRPDVIVLDVMMPGKNGWEVAKEMRADDQLKGVGILMLTAIGPKVNEITSPLYGTDDYLDKPFEFDVLESKIQAVLAKRAPAKDAKPAKRAKK